MVMMISLFWNFCHWPDRRTPCLFWGDQPNRRFPTSLSELLEQEAELQESFLYLYG